MMYCNRLLYSVLLLVGCYHATSFAASWGFSPATSSRFTVYADHESNCTDNKNANSI